MKTNINQLWRGLRSINLASLALLRQPKVFVDFLRQCNKLFASYTLKPIETIEVQSLINTECSELYLPIHWIKPGSTPFYDLVILASLCRMNKPLNIFEIGTFEGLSAVVFALNSLPDTRVYTLDLPSERTDIRRTERSFSANSIGCANQVTRLLGDSALFDFSPYEGKIDLFFIDGAHTEDYVALDTFNAFKCIRDNSLVIWHDCLVPQVLKVLKLVAKYLPVKYIQGTNIAILLGKPDLNFPWQILQRKIR